MNDSAVVAGLDAVKIAKRDEAERLEKEELKKLSALKNWTES